MHTYQLLSAAAMVTSLARNRVRYTVDVHFGSRRERGIFAPTELLFLNLVYYNYIILFYVEAKRSVPLVRSFRCFFAKSHFQLSQVTVTGNSTKSLSCVWSCLAVFNLAIIRLYLDYFRPGPPPFIWSWNSRTHNYRKFIQHVQV